MRKVYIVEKGWFYEGGEVVAVLSSLIEAKALQSDIKRLPDFNKDVNYVTITPWTIGSISRHEMYEIIRNEEKNICDKIIKEELDGYENR